MNLENKKKNLMKYYSLYTAGQQIVYFKKYIFDS